MRQLPLAISPDKRTLKGFVTSRNVEVLALLARIAEDALTVNDQRFVYLWGESGSGKSHLLHALQSERVAARLLGPGSAEGEFEWQTGVDLYLIDDCDRLSPVLQVAAFALFNQIRENGGVLVTTGAAAPAALDLREDLRTRLGWGLVYQLHALTDEEKTAALERAAGERGFELAAGVLPWLITHYRRDMTSLAALLDALDRYSLETKRPVTLPLLRELLQRGELQHQE